MKLPPLTGREARLLLDHLDNAQASNLPDDVYGLFWSAKSKLLDIEVADEMKAERAARDLRMFTRAA